MHRQDTGITFNFQVEVGVERSRWEERDSTG